LQHIGCKFEQNMDKKRSPNLEPSRAPKIHKSSLSTVHQVPGNMINHCSVEKEIFSGQQKVDNVILRWTHCNAATDAKVAKDVQDLRVAAELLEQRDDHLDVLFLHHVQGLRGVIKDAV